MFMPLPGRFGRPAKMLPSPFRQDEDAWRLDVVPVAQDLDAGEYGLLDPRLAEEPALPREGLLSRAALQQSDASDSVDLPMPDRKPTPPSRYKMRPGALRDNILPMPPYLDEDDWYAFDRALRRSGMQTETEIDTARRIFGFEGGMRSAGPNGPVAGLTRTFLGSDPNALSIDEAARAYRAYFDDQMKRIGPDASLAQIHDSKAAGQLMDLLFHFGGRDGTLVVQQGVNDMVARLSDADMHRRAVFPLEEDGGLGPLTYSVFNRLINNGYGHRLRNHIADRAQDYIIAHPESFPSTAMPYFRARTDAFR